MSDQIGSVRGDHDNMDGTERTLTSDFTMKSDGVVAPCRLFALVWAMIFLLLINAGAFLVFSGSQDLRRFSQHTSYEEIRDAVERIRRDPRPKIVFIGGSVMWGSSSPDAADTIPQAFSGLAGSGVVVYNLGLIGARPLDMFILALLVKDSAQAIIMDYNYAFGFTVSRDRLFNQPQSYIRMSQLFSAHADALFREVPVIKDCLDAAGLPSPQGISSTERFLQDLAEDVIPVVRFKNRINASLFGQHPLLLIERTGLALGKYVHARTPVSIAELLAPPEERIDPTPWNPETGMKSELSDDSFTQDGLLNCMAAGYVAEARRTNMPLFLYVTPNNPGMFASSMVRPAFSLNNRFFDRLFAGLRYKNFNDGSFPAHIFTSSTHFTPAGTHVFAKFLYMTFAPSLRHLGLPVR